MNRFVWVAVGLGVALVAPVSAGTMFRYISPPSQNQVVASGQIDADGHIVRGTGFAVQHLRRGEYLITFRAGYFPTGCAAMTVTPAELLYANIGRVHQESFDNRFRVEYNYQISDRANTPFYFIAVGD